MDEIPDTDKEYMMFLLTLINNFLLENKVPEWFSIKKIQTQMSETASATSETEDE
jgi:hypothetical protein